MKNISVESEFRGEAALRVCRLFRDRSYTVGELADAIDKSQSWTSEVASDLEGEHLVERNDGFGLANTYEATLLADLLDRYRLEKILTGTTENILVALRQAPETIAGLEKQGFTAPPAPECASRPSLRSHRDSVPQARTSMGLLGMGEDITNDRKPSLLWDEVSEFAWYRFVPVTQTSVQNGAFDRGRK